MNPDPIPWHRLHAGRLAADERVVLPMITGSMAPLIPAGSHIEVAAPPPAGVDVGQVVVFRRGVRLVAHRLLFGCPLPAPGWFLQRGDGVSTAGVISARDIVGVVVAVQLQSGERHDLTTPAARHQALRTARRTLYRLLLGRLTRPRGKDDP